MAAVAAGVHYGMKNRIDPGPMVEQGAEIVPKLKIPNRWDAAIDKFQRGKILPEYFGKDYCSYYAMVRRYEAEQYHNKIAQLDFDWYLAGRLAVPPGVFALAASSASALISKSRWTCCPDPPSTCDTPHRSPLWNRYSAVGFLRITEISIVVIPIAFAARDLLRLGPRSSLSRCPRCRGNQVGLATR